MLNTDILDTSYRHTEALIREATFADIPALAQLQVKTFVEAFPHHPQPPTIQTRQHQWIEQFKVKATTWFCLVAENDKRELIGFAKGHAYSHSDLPDYHGELNKIYVLKDYQRLGIGRKLFEASVNKFKTMDIQSFVVFGAGTETANSFYEKMDGDKLFASSGEFHGGYGWGNK
jgi:ribosomal protein S18 acetylase RimI-like enzyme